MSTYVLMKILESFPDRYDRGIRFFTRGRIDEVYDHLTSYIREGQRVIDIGCGTGALTVRTAKKKAYVKGIDINSRMLEVAYTKVVEANLTPYVEFSEMGVAELFNEESESYHCAVSSLCFSELTDDELSYTLKEVKRILKPGGFLLVFDESQPQNIYKRMLNWMIRIPFVIITYLITQTTTKVVNELPEKVKEVGLQIELVRLNKRENYVELVGRKFEAT